MQDVIAGVNLRAFVPMSAFSLFSLLLTLAAILAFLNYRFLRLPSTVGLMVLSLTLSAGLLILGKLGFPLQHQVASVVSNINFSEALLDGMLSFLLFAGSLHVEIGQLREEKGNVLALATVGVLISTVCVGFGSWIVFSLLGAPVSLLLCLTFGALISPTDPIAVMGLLKEARAPGRLATQIAGESLFNDGVGIVVFLVLERLLRSGSGSVGWEQILALLFKEVVGGLALGLALGGLCFLLLKSVNNFQVEVMLTLALVSGGFQLATALHASGPLATVTAGLLIGNYGRSLAMSEQTRHNLDSFWEVLDEILNAILFVLMGLEVLLLKIEPIYLAAAALMIPLALLARLTSLALPAALSRLFRGSGLQVSILTWTGLRGGISIALALTLPAGSGHDLVLVATYGVVAFSILVQATTTPRFLRRALGNSARAAER